MNRFGLPRAVIVLTASVVLLAGCARESVVIYAPPELAGATISINGRPAGQFSDTQRNYRWVGFRKLREELNAPPRSETFVRLEVSPGSHFYRIEKTGIETISGRFDYRGQSRIAIEIEPSRVKESGHDESP